MWICSISSLRSINTSTFEIQQEVIKLKFATNRNWRTSTKSNPNESMKPLEGTWKLEYSFRTKLRICTNTYTDTYQFAEKLKNYRVHDTAKQVPHDSTECT